MSGKKKNTSLKQEKLSFVAELSRTASWISNRYTKHLSKYDISGPQLNILRVLRTANDWKAMNEINELLIVKSPNITRLADKLVDKGLIARNRSEEDRRVVYVKISDKGLELLSEFDKEHEGTLSDYMESFSVEEAMMMTEILRKIRS